jgi:2-isopropylmalate synthase
MSEQRVHLFDTTLRDGAQTQGVDFGPADKVAIARALDRLGVDYIEGGWPGANPTDDAFFAEAPKLARARLVAFGMTRRAGRSALNDPGLSAVLAAETPAVCLVGKTWDFNVTTALEIELDENLRMIGDSIARVAAAGREPMFDAEHFFDGYQANPDYALACLTAALDAGARWLVLCDTNGGTLPDAVHAIVSAVGAHVPAQRLGIHCHDDTGNAVANSLAAVAAGARQIQGTLNGLGERCGNANLVTLIPTLALKTDFEVGIGRDALKHLTAIAHEVDERLNRAPNRHAPYVGAAAFAHKGGLHASAVARDPRCYEHIDPATVGNRRHVVVSDQAGRANVLARLAELGIAAQPNDKRLDELLRTVKTREHQGFAYDGAAASFELLARGTLGEVPEFFRLISFRVMDERRWSPKGEPTTISEATVKLFVGGERHMAVAEGNGPVNALDQALRTVLVPHYPALADLRLVDYKVRILTPSDGTGAITRVMIESAGGDGQRWATVGVSANIIDASFRALHDSLVFCLMKAGYSVNMPMRHAGPRV